MSLLIRKLTLRQKRVLRNISAVALRPTPFAYNQLWCLENQIVVDVLRSLFQRKLIVFDREAKKWKEASPDLTRAALDDSLYAMI